MEAAGEEVDGTADCRRPRRRWLVLVCLLLIAATLATQLSWSPPETATIDQGDGRAVAGDRFVLSRLVPGGGEEEMTAIGRGRNPDISRQGAVAFVSDRSGHSQIWVADPGRPPVAVTRFQGLVTSTPRWSPDGRRLALVAEVDGGTGLFVLDRGSDRLRRVAVEQGAEDRAPFWSRDGQRLYFASTREGGWRIWVSRPPYEQAQPITEPGWRVAKESGDGRWLYMVRDGEGGLWRQPADGGLPERIADLPAADDAENWAAGSAGTYLIERLGGDRARILLLPGDGGAWRTVAELPGMSTLAVGPDGQVVISRPLSEGGDGSPSR